MVFEEEREDSDPHAEKDEVCDPTEAGGERYQAYQAHDQGQAGNNFDVDGDQCHSGNFVPGH